jgi:hypothetical protein
MISFKALLKKVLLERMSFRDLLSYSDPERIKRSDDVSARNLQVTSADDGNEMWRFSYKSNPSTTGNRHRGNITFFKENVSISDSADDLDCMVDCSCPDYRYRFAYNNARADAGDVGARTLNQNNGNPPRYPSNDLGPGLCKHLIALGEYLKTNIEPNAPEPEAPKPIVKQPFKPSKPSKPIVKSQPSKPSSPSQKPQTINAPEPDDTYSDTRGGLYENKSKLYDKMQQFVNQNPEFTVQYYDDED